MATNMPPVHAVNGTYATRETCRWAANEIARRARDCPEERVPLRSELDTWSSTSFQRCSMFSLHCLHQSFTLRFGTNLSAAPPFCAVSFFWNGTNDEASGATDERLASVGVEPDGRNDGPRG